MAEDITVAATGITSAITEAHKTVAKEEATEVAAMTGTTAVVEITVMAVIRMAITSRTVDKRTEIARMETRMAEETVHKMEGIVAEETSIPQPILVNIAALAQEGTESNLCSVSHLYDSITLLHLDSVELRTSLQQC